MLGTPFTAGTLTSAASSATYSVPVSTPVPVGATVIVFAGAAGATSATSVTDSQGNAYSANGFSTSNEYLAAFTCLSITTPLNPLAGDAWTVTFSAANTQQKNVIAVAVTGGATFDNGAASNGSSTSPSATQTASQGNDVLIACIQNANAGGAPSGFNLTTLTSLSPAGQQYTTVGYGYVTSAGSVTASATITSAPWAVITTALYAAAPVALGASRSPAGGALLPPYPVLPAPRTWSAEDQFWTPRLRNDPGNAITLLTNPPLYIGGQTFTAQSVASAAVTTLSLDTDLMDSWAAHQQPSTTVAPPLAGWYLTEGHVFINTNGTAAGVQAAGIQAVQNGATYQTDGGKVTGNGANSPIPVVADLIQVSPSTQDTIALYCWQDSGITRTISSAWIKTEWVCASSGTVVAPPAPAAGWTSGATTLLAAVSAGATSLLVADPTGILPTSVIALDYGNAAQESVTVTSVSGQTIGISPPCIYPHPASAPVSVPISSVWMNQQIRDKINLLTYRPIARLSNAGVTQSLAAQTWPAGTAVQWANPAFTSRCVDNFGGWNSSNPTRYTFIFSGVYYLYGQVYCADAASPYVLSAGLAISGGTIQWGDRVKSVGSVSESVCATVRRAAVRVTAGQYVEVYGSQSSGGTLALQNSGNSLCKLIVVWRGL